MDKQTVTDIDVRGKRVFCRVDLNVPLKDTVITDDTRIRSALPTIQYLIEQGAKVILCSHLGRPKGKVVEELRLTPIAKCLSKYLKKPVLKCDDTIGPYVEAKIKELENSDVLLLENVRFYPGEEENHPDFVGALVRLADIFVNDAFGTAHRIHASTVGIAKYLPAVAGFLMQNEITTFSKVLYHPQRPFTAIIGGSKVKDKIEVIENLLPKVDHLLIGGGLSFTFIHAMGYETGQSLFEADKEELAKKLLDAAREKLVLPLDVIVADQMVSDADIKNVSIEDIPASMMGLDIGPRTVKTFSDIIQSSQLAVWNGPMGVFEIDTFSTGTMGIAQAMAETKATTVVGGGDSIAAIEQAGVTKDISHISTGGGASLEFLEGKSLPGVVALNNR